MDHVGHLIMMESRPDTRMTDVFQDLVADYNRYMQEVLILQSVRKPSQQEVALRKFYPAATYSNNLTYYDKIEELENITRQNVEAQLKNVAAVVELIVNNQYVKNMTRDKPGCLKAMLLNV